MSITKTREISAYQMSITPNFIFLCSSKPHTNQMDKKENRLTSLK